MTINEKYQLARKNGKAFNDNEQNTIPQEPNSTQQELDSTPKPTTSLSRPSHVGNKWTYGVIAFLTFLIICIVSCPKEQEHSIAVKAVMEGVIKQNVNGLFLSMGENFEEPTDGMDKMLYDAIINNYADKIMKNDFQVSNHLIYSTGYIISANQSFRISIGCLGHVFILCKPEGIVANGWDVMTDYIEGLY